MSSLVVSYEGDRGLVPDRIRLMSARSDPDALLPGPSIRAPRSGSIRQLVEYWGSFADFPT